MPLRPSLLALAVACTLAACGANQSDAPAAAGERRLAAAVARPAAVATAVFARARDAYTITTNAGGYLVTANLGSDAPVQLAANVRLRFADQTIAFGADATAARAYRVYKAAFNRTPDLAGLGYWISAMDNGVSLDAVAAEFASSAEFQALYGANPSNLDIVQRYYLNVLGRAGEAAGITYWVAGLDQKLSTIGGVLASFSDSAENLTATATIIGSGIAFAESGVSYAAVAPAPAGSVKAKAAVAVAALDPVTVPVAVADPAVPAAVATPPAAANLRLWIYDPLTRVKVAGTPGIFIKSSTTGYAFQASNADGSTTMTLAAGSYDFDTIEPQVAGNTLTRHSYHVDVSAAGVATIAGKTADARGFFAVTLDAPATTTALAKDRLAALTALANQPASTFVPNGACQLVDQVTPNRSLQTDISAGFPRVRTRLPAFGHIRALIVPVDFAEVPGTDDPVAFFTPIADNMRDFYLAQSYGRLAFDFEVLKGWSRMPFLATKYGLGSGGANDVNGYRKEMVALLDPLIDFSQYDAVYFLLPKTMPYATIAAGPAITGPIATRNGYINNGASGGGDMYLPGNGVGASWKWMAHETGHAFGLYDEDLNHASPTLGSWGLMANNWSSNAIEHGGWDRYLLGWIGATQTACLPRAGLSTAGTTVALSPLVRQGAGVKVALVPLSASKMLVVESRKNEGYDHIVASHEGVLVYTVDMTIGQLKGGYQTVRRPGSTDYYYEDAALHAGDSVTVDGVVVTVVALGADGDTVKVGLK